MLKYNNQNHTEGSKVNEFKIIELIITFALMLSGFGIIWGKHTESVKAMAVKSDAQDLIQSEKNLAQDLAIVALHEKIQAREDKIRTDVENRLKTIEGKLDKILFKVSANISNL